MIWFARESWWLQELRRKGQAFDGGLIIVALIEGGRPGRRGLFMLRGFTSSSFGASSYKLQTELAT